MKIEKVKKLVANLHDQTECVIHIGNLKQALNYRLILKKFHRVIRSNQNVWLKSYIVMNTGLRKKAKHDFEKDVFKLMNNGVFGKTMKMLENIEMLNLSQHKKEETVSCHNQIIILQSFSQKIY